MAAPRALALALCWLAGACAEHLEDELALLQVSAQAHSQQAQVATPGRGRASKLGMLRKAIRESETFSCAASPELCEAPFDCHEFRQSEALTWEMSGLAHGGRPNHQAFCLMPVFAPFASKCAKGDLDAAADVQYVMTMAGRYGPSALELDASACFIDGHCADQSITNITTAEEAMALCDRRFGREAWATTGSRLTEPQVGAGEASVKDLDPLAAPIGFSSPEQTRPMLLASCAMGNYHCDAVYCKKFYCQDPRYVQKYGHWNQQR